MTLPVFDITETHANNLNGMGNVWAGTILPDLYLYDNDNHDAHLVQVALVGGTYEVVPNGTVVGMSPSVPMDAHDGIQNYFEGLGGNPAQINPIGNMPSSYSGTSGNTTNNYGNTDSAASTDMPIVALADGDFGITSANAGNYIIVLNDQGDEFDGNDVFEAYLVTGTTGNYSVDTDQPPVTLNMSQNQFDDVMANSTGNDTIPDPFATNTTTTPPTTPPTTPNMPTTWTVLKNVDYTTAQGLLGADVDAVYSSQGMTKSFAVSPTGDATIVKIILVFSEYETDPDGNPVEVFNIMTGSGAFSKDIDITLMSGITPDGTTMGEVAEYGAMVSQSLPFYQVTNPNDPADPSYSVVLTTGKVLGGEFVILEHQSQFVIAKVESHGATTKAVLMGDSQDYQFITADEKAELDAQVTPQTVDTLVPENIGLALAQPVSPGTGTGTGTGTDAPTEDSGYDADVFEIVKVGLNEGPQGSGGRFGAIETFGIRLIDDGDGDADEVTTFTNIDLQINWEEGEYMFWGNYVPGDTTPTESGESFSNSLILSNLDNIKGNPAGDQMDLALFSSDNVAYTEGDYLATFMMERTDTSGSTENTITLTTSSYNLDSDATEEDPFPVDRSPPAEDFDFTYNAHEVKIKLSNARGEEADHPRLFVSSGSVSDGLSIVPVAKVGHIVKYEVVLNISRPTFIDSTATVAASQGISIYGAKIFKESVVDKTSMAEVGSQTAEILAGASSTITVSASDTTAVASTLITPSAGLKGHEFFEIAGGVLDPETTITIDGNVVDETALDTVDSLFLSFSGLSKPTVGTPTDAEGRYVLAEFVALGNNDSYDDIKFTSGVDSGSGIVMGGEITIDHEGGGNSEAKAAEAADPTPGEYWTETVADGSDIVLLAESIFENPESHEDAITAGDALGALYVSRAEASGVTYTQSQIIAADFNQSGDVTSADAYDILKYSVFGAEPGGAIPKWVYVDDIEDGTSTAAAVDYDTNIDLFVGDTVEIDATAVLIGDVSESYEPLSEGSSSRYYGNALEFFMMDRTDVTVDVETFDPAVLMGTSVAENFIFSNSGAEVDAPSVPSYGMSIDSIVPFSGIDWRNDTVEFAVTSPDGSERYRYDTEDAGDGTDEQADIEEMAGNAFEAGETIALMVDYHTGGVGNGEQLFLVDLDEDGTLSTGDLAILFTNVDKNDFIDDASISFA